MSSALKEETNYWPGYVDALINVLLNLLFLVGIFTVGLVTLNSQALILQKAAAQLQVTEMLEGSSGKQRQDKAQKLLLDMAPQPKPGPSPKLDAGPQAPAAPAAPASELPEPDQRLDSAPMPPRVTEIRIKRTQVVAAAQPERALPAAAPEAVGAAAMLQRLNLELGGAVVSQFAFGINEYDLPTNAAVLPAGPLPQGVTYQLIALAESGNQRLSREAFFRVMSVRTALVQKMPQLGTLQVRIVPPPPDLASQDEWMRTVFLVAKPQ
jgi:hypothetical protein